ncbi:hypothetical protein [Chachezhania sediminis]|uniref:hypothetical protein n=1 Tax=Chachezhania sediminis TaxID=2599291 RepID=UPI00131D26D4|nr:hypothetical protein [Chachezhania sediminis]
MKAVATINAINTMETVRLDPDCLTRLYCQLGETGAEDVIGRAVEELAVRLAQCTLQRCNDDMVGLRKSVRAVAAIAEQIGMNTLARVARDASEVIENGDDIALDAILARLMRIGESSLTAVWDLHHLPV